MIDANPSSTEPGEREWLILWQQIEASYGNKKVCCILTPKLLYKVFLVTSVIPTHTRNAVRMSMKVTAIQQEVTQRLPTQPHFHLPSLLG